MLVVLKNVWFGYTKDNPIFRGLSLKFGKGINCIFGRNGSGKTTLLRIIIGSLKPSRGGIYINEKRIRTINDAKGLVTYVPSEPTTFLVGPKVIDELNRVKEDPPQEIKSLSKLKIFELSEGQRRLLAIFIATSTQTPVIIMDEPTVGLDKPSRNWFVQRLIKASKQGKTIIIATNDVRLIPICDHYYIIGRKGIDVVNDALAAIRKLPYNMEIKQLLLKLEKEKATKFRSLQDFIDELRRRTC